MTGWDYTLYGVIWLEVFKMKYGFNPMGQWWSQVVLDKVHRKVNFRKVVNTLLSTNDILKSGRIVFQMALK